MCKDDLELKIPSNLQYPQSYKEYFEELINKTREAYTVAIQARSKGFDPHLKPEISLAFDLASRVEAMVGPKGIANRIRSLQEEGKELEEIAVIIAEEIASGLWKLDEDNPEKIAEQAIRTSLAIVTNGIVAAPLEGIVKVKVRPEKHLAVYYAGPIRSAGGTETAMSVLLADIVRRALGLRKYEPTKEEIERMVEEVFLYKRYSNLQYPPNRDKIVFAMQNIPIEINGEGTDKEVQMYRRVRYVDTPKIRGGAVLVINDGLIAKAKKLLKIIRRLGIDGWDWLEELTKIGHAENNAKAEQDKKESNSDLNPAPKIEPNYSYMREVVVGRPVFASPMRYGGFRLRYGRSRNTGLAAVGIHPSTMYLLDEFLAVSTQIKPERPGKGAIVLPVDSIDPPIVLLKDGSVVEVKSIEDAKRIREHVEKILFLGDMLISVGEFLENNHIILPSPIVEEWWRQELREKLSKIGEGSHLKEYEEKALRDPKFMVELVERLDIPWHPRFTYFWKNISGEELIYLLKKINEATDSRLMFDENLKKILEKLLILHRVSDGQIVLPPEDYTTLKIIAARIFEKIGLNNVDGPNALEILRRFGFNIYDKYTFFIGARMGRPEKAKHREMKPAVHVLFPIGEAGKSTRSVTRILDKAKTFEIEASSMFCEKCQKLVFYPFCPSCGSRTTPVFVCASCGYISRTPIKKCPRCGSRRVQPYTKFKVDFKQLLGEIEDKHKVKMPKDLRCVIGLISKRKMPEYLAKGLLRAKYNLSVFRDGTIRFDATDAPLTHFRPQEIGVSIEKLKKLGYTRDIYGAALEREDQILELKVQDIIINEEAAEYLVRVAQFIDELLMKVYGIEPYYKVKDKHDLVGHLVIGLAPHTSAGIVGRIIGFTKARCVFAHPYWHAAKRRNCDGDEDSIILLLDGLINFSKEYLPKSRGGQMDAPLIVTVILNPLEVDSEVYNLDTMREIPLEFYRKSLEYPDPGEIEDLIDNIEKRLGKPEQYMNIDFSFDTSQIDMGPTITAYVKARNMADKLAKQIKLMKKIVAIDYADAVGKVLESHVLRDIFGNLRSFGTQSFKCTRCRRTFRRIPVNGKCPYCGNTLQPSVYINMVLKFFSIAREIVSDLDEEDFRSQQFHRFLATDYKVLRQTSITDLTEKLINRSSNRTEKRDVVMRKIKINLADFF